MDQGPAHESLLFQRRHGYISLKWTASEAEWWEAALGVAELIVFIHERFPGKLQLQNQQKHKTQTTLNQVFHSL